MARIPQEVIRSVQDSVDVVDVISEFVSLKRTGNSFKGLCPFHEEKTPSFHVFPATGTFKCFGCGEHGRAIDFLMRHTRATFREVVAQLADRSGIAIPEEPQSPQEADAAQRRVGVLQALRFANGFFRAVFQRETGEPARRYLSERGFDAATIEAFEIGFSPDDFEGLLSVARQKGVAEAALFDAGLIRRNERGKVYDMFRGRIMFPIHDLRGDIVAFGARAMGDAQPKYLNSPDGMAFRKGREMYGLLLARDAARQAGRIVLVEGYTDVMHCHQAGMAEVAAGLGTALTAENARQLRRFAVPVVLLYDGDEAGRRAAERAAETLLAENVPGSVALLPPGHDPADWVKAHGAAGLEEVLSKSRDLWTYRMEAGLGRHDLDTLAGRDAAIRDVGEVIGRIADPIRAELALKLLAERAGVAESTVRNTFGTSAGPTRFGPGARAAESDADEPSGPPAAPGWQRAERDFLQAALYDGSLWPQIAEVYPAAMWKEPRWRAIAHVMDDLRGRGQSLVREALLSELADEDHAVRAIQSLEPSEAACERSLHALDRLAQQARLRAAAGQPEGVLAAMVRARRGMLLEEADDRASEDWAADGGAGGRSSEET